MHDHMYVALIGITCLKDGGGDYTKEAHLVRTNRVEFGFSKRGLQVRPDAHYYNDNGKTPCRLD